MDMMQKYAADAAKRSIRQYCQPRCYEFAGKTLRFVVDTGEGAGNYTLTFTGKTELEWSRDGGAPGKAQYECRKSDDDTYLLTYCIAGLTPRENHTWVIDLENELVTYLRCALGENAFDPYIIESHFGFGYVEIDGKPHTVSYGVFGKIFTLNEDDVATYIEQNNPFASLKELNSVGKDIVGEAKTIEEAIENIDTKGLLDNLGDELVGTMGQLVKKQMTERTDSATGDALERIIDGVTDIIKNGIREE